MHYNLEAILAVGCRVRSHRGTQFRKWATERLREYLVKGFVLDDARLKEGKNIGADYFDELLERIRDIRASEKRFYQREATRGIENHQGEESMKVIFADPSPLWALATSLDWIWSW
jgi:hypothetical protein